ncbi:Asp-tRNA(Asn)/Glu-tRNA(Gln) amidotransferase GatCAB subunit C [Coxiella endosymbiont of Amblyomma sculptum]|uniref:Asp-tRNA(Asn)/Glu-tRNA(Gln) amidotransferase subunit GatC n=1 Tax=Coxiella endosymbiont of Amblyomma sculptum TaxID=2487929 RepID=UPI00132F207F|nr:Asp-tRNA(Asn)/Glu-tRNA(Gln) amidotransferase subunit GatC [Coxiella endosymbiont of Amblyomma sculptum]QHG92303.1 Asp-tRNA(Asn)/Glu-tRNA(Gln) amidotransferase GatCAB subunit C [Coxiella endosymbiont of Amblyomma sculptum]
MPNLKKIDIYKTANLAKLIISKSEEQLLKSALNEILKFANKMNKINTMNTGPFAHFSKETQILREDIVTETNQRALLQKNTSRIKNGLYVIPAVSENLSC